MTIGQIYIGVLISGIVIGFLSASFIYGARIVSLKHRLNELGVRDAMRRHPAGRELPPLPGFLTTDREWPGGITSTHTDVPSPRLGDEQGPGYIA